MRTRVGAGLMALVASLAMVFVLTAQAHADCANMAGSGGLVETCTSGSSVGIEAATTAGGNDGPAAGASWGPPAASAAPLPPGAVVWGGGQVCVPSEESKCLTPSPVPVSGGGAGVDVAAAARSAAASLGVPAPVIGLSPAPSGNQWGALGVGLPIWVWLDDPGSVGSSASQDGIDISLSAVRGSVAFDWGDGTSTVCTQMQERPGGVDPLVPSPVCGHAYMKAGDYTITATSSWEVGWQALGQQGQVSLSSSGTYQMPIREFVSVVVG